MSLEMGDIPEAEKALEEAQRAVGATDWLARMNIRVLGGDVALARGDVEAASEAYRSVLEEAERRSAAYLIMQSLTDAAGRSSPMETGKWPRLVRPGRASSTSRPAPRGRDSIGSGGSTGWVRHNGLDETTRIDILE